MIKLTVEEKKILNGEEGQIKKKLLESIVLFGDFFGAKDLTEITGVGHLVLGFGSNGFEAVTNILNELIEHKLKTKYPFTVNTWTYATTVSQEKMFGLFTSKNSAERKQAYLQHKLLEIGLNKENNYMDTIKLASADCVKFGDVLCWSDSTLVTFANSAIGARVNNSGPLIDLFCNILGKVPNYGFLTKEGRQADVIIKVEMDKLPDAGLLGVAVAQKANGKVPYIYGLEKLLKAKYDEKTSAFLKDFSAGLSSESSLRIFHVNGITPEAKKYKKELINPASQIISIDEQELERVKENFELSWKNLDAKPTICFIGQPDLSLYQLVYWTNEIGWELKQNRRKKLKIKTVFLTNNEVFEQFKKLPEYQELKSYGGKIKTISPFNNLMSKKKIRAKIITNSNLIRNNTNCKFGKEEDILDMITGKKRRKV